MKEVSKATVVDFSDTEIAFSNKSDADLKKSAFLFRMMNNPFLVRVGSSLGVWATKWNLPLSKRLIEATIFYQFCGGKTLLESQETIDRLNQYGAVSVLDYGVEGKTEEKDLDATLAELQKAVQFAASNTSVPVVSTKITSLASNTILTKWQSEKGLNEKEQTAYERVVHRVDALCKNAYELGISVFIDAEETWMQETIDHLAYLMMERYNRERVTVYNTYQLYRVDALEKLRRDHKVALEKGYIFGAKLVRGAYMEKERERAMELGYPSPIQPDKESTDRDYNDAVRYCVDNYQTMGSCNATHNVRSNMLQAELIEERGIPRNNPHLNFCQLLGMSDYITFNLAEAGFNVGKYVVYGPVKDVLPYLVRRAEENTSVTGDMSRELQLISTELKRRGL